MRVDLGDSHQGCNLKLITEKYFASLTRFESSYQDTDREFIYFLSCVYVQILLSRTFSEV